MAGSSPLQHWSSIMAVQAPRMRPPALACRLWWFRSRATSSSGRIACAKPAPRRCPCAPRAQRGSAGAVQRRGARFVRRAGGRAEHGR